MSDSNALPIAGWYPDPENEAGDRWWNGVSWSDHRRPRAAAGLPPIPVPPVAAAPAERPNPYAMAAPPAYAPNYQAASSVRNPAALGGMITSLVALACNFILFGAPGIVGAIVSFVGLRRANQLERQGYTVGNGRAMAITGIVVGLLGAFLWDLFYFTIMASYTS